jgi:glycosyltransferase involved in cell wall biosynthesis
VGLGSAPSRGRAGPVGKRVIRGGRVCLFAPYLWPLFSERPIPFVGGAEVQQAAIARGLAKRGFPVVVATCDYGQGQVVECDGITFLATHPPFAGWPVVRFFHPRLTGNLRALNAAAADLYYARLGGLPAGLAFDVARARGAAFVLGVGNDRDADPRLPGIPLARDRWWYRRALRGADAVVAQTEEQRRLFREGFGRECEVIPNLVSVPVAAVDAGREGALVWLSTYKRSKRPEWFVELARRHPRRRFVMAGVVPPPPLTGEVWEEAREAARGLPNLDVRGPLDHARIGELFREAGLFVHTSIEEGFPNTLLEAWAHGLPALSAFDPGGILARERLGATADSIDGFDRAVTEWMDDSDRRRDAGFRARTYVEAHHAPDAVIDRLATLFDRLIGERARRNQRAPGSSR